MCRSRAHIQRCSGETDPNLLAPSNEEDGCSLESGDIDESEVLSQNENVRNFKTFLMKLINFVIFI